MNSPADSIIMKGLVELYDLERGSEGNIRTWLADTMSMVTYMDKSAKLRRHKAIAGGWVL